MNGLLELRWQTPPEWATTVARAPLELLSDHAHCELGAAASAQGLIARVPGDARLVDRLAAVAAEEMAHFREVHRLLSELGGSLEAVRRNAYAEALLARGRRPGSEGLLDRLLISALIERRSLERFELLARHAPSPLKELYGSLAPSEAGHALLFVELAGRHATEDEVAARLEELATAEAEIARGLPFAPRIHAGPPPADAAPLQQPAATAERTQGRATTPCS